MSNKFSQPYNKIAAALIMLSPVAAVNAAEPFFVENSTLNSQLEFLFNPQKNNAEYLSLAINNKNDIFSSYKDSKTAKQIFVSKYSQANVTVSASQSVSLTTAPRSFTQIKVNPLGDSFALAYIENGTLKVKTSSDGTSWTDTANQPATVDNNTPLFIKMELDSQGNIYLLYTYHTDQTKTVGIWSEVLKFDSTTETWGTLFSKERTKATTWAITADIAISSQDKPYFVYRDVVDQEILDPEQDKTKIKYLDDNNDVQTIDTAGLPQEASYLKAGFDNLDNLHIVYEASADNGGVSVYKLEGSPPLDLGWELVGDANFSFDKAFAENYTTTTKKATPLIDMAFDSKNTLYVAFQQLNNQLASKKVMRLAKFENNVWNNISYDLASVSNGAADLTKTIHNYIDLEIDAYDRPVTLIRAAGAGGSAHNSWPYALRQNFLPADPTTTIPFSINEDSVIAGNLVVGKLTASDDDNDAITLTLTGDDAGLFNIDQNTGEISFKVAPVIASDSTYNLTVDATANGDITSVNVQVTLVNDSSNDVVDVDVDVDSDGDGVADNDDAFPDDIAASIDTDGDGFPDDWNDGKTADDSTSETPLVKDAFPLDIAASIDTDNDGFPDAWNVGKDAGYSTTGLTTLDAFPYDILEWLDSDNDGVGDNSDYYPNDDSKNVNIAPVVTVPDNITVAATDNTGTAKTNALIAKFLTAASALDFDDGIISVDHDAPDVFELGETVVNFTATDDGGSKVTEQATVTIADQTAPVITLSGDSALTLNDTDTYVELGATATDNVDETVEVTSAVTVEGVTVEGVDTSTPATYIVTYTAEDIAGYSATVTRTITVQDISTPVVTAPNNIIVAATDGAGTAIDHADIVAFLSAAIASDEQDGDVIVTHNAPPVFPLDVATTVIFSATDTDGNTGTSQATVTVTDKSKPIITLVGKNSLTVALNGSYIDAGSSASDNVDGDITANVSVTGTVDTNTIGTYTLTYNVSDAKGNIAETLTRQITVQDASAPVVSAPQNIIVAATDSDGTSISDGAIGAFLDAATAKDAVEGDINDITNNALNVFPLGVTTVTFTAQDSVGNAGTAQATITVVDKTAPVITLTAATVEIIVGDSYIEPGASAADNVDGDISANVVIGSDALDTNIVGTYSLTYDVTDIAGNAAAQVTRQVVVLNLPDSDGDGVPDVDDAFETDAAASIDTDNDGSPDSWNDGKSAEDSTSDLILDAFPTDANEKLDTDGDGFGDVMDPNPTDASDGTAPVFAEEIATIKMDATATLTDISAAIAASGITALDMFDGAVIAELASTELIYASGNHVITLSATDLAGNKSTAEVDLAINPVVQLGASLTAETGGQLTIPVALSGPAATYPVVLDYTVTNLDEVEAKGQLTLEEGAVMAELLIDISADVQQGDELVIQFTQATNAVVTELTKVSAVINNENYAPTLKVSISQAGQPVSVISPNLGLVTLTAAVTDLNSVDEHNISFEVIGGEFIDDGIDEAPNTLVFDPLNLETGSYPVTVTVAETNTDALLVSAVTIQVNVDTELTDLVADSDQDGIPDSVDTSSDTTRLPIAEDEQPLQVLPGLTLSIGDLAAGGDSATIDADVVSSDIHFNALSTITNFNVGGLTISGSSVAVVLPLAKDVTIPSYAIYRKYSEAKGWFTFVEDENNSLSSALKDDNGNCPAPSSSDYLTEDTLLANGLIEGNNCIQLTIEDGGANDADETANGTVVDPGVLVSEFENTLPEISLSNTAATSRQAVNLQAAVTDAEGDELSYTWEQIDGLSVDIGTASSDTLSFTAPEVVEGTDLRFKLTVHDGRASTSEEVKVTVTPESVIDTDPRGGSFGWLLSLVALIGLGRRKLSK